MVLKQIDPSTLPDETLERRLYYAKYSNDPVILRALSQDSFWFVRDHVAGNVNTPADCLQGLLTDPDFRVRREAERTLSRQESRSGHTTGAKAPLTEQLAAAAAKSTPTSGHVTEQSQER